MSTETEIEPLYKRQGPARTILFMTGVRGNPNAGGSNTREILKRFVTELDKVEKDMRTVPFLPEGIFTDNPGGSAYKIGAEFKDQVIVPVYSNDIDLWHAEHGLKKTRENRPQYDEVQSKLFKGKADIIALAGYDWIVSRVIFEYFLTLNVHPGNLDRKSVV